MYFIFIVININGNINSAIWSTTENSRRYQSAVFYFYYSVSSLVDRAEHVVILRYWSLQFLLLASYLRPMMNHPGQHDVVVKKGEKEKKQDGWKAHRGSQ